MLCFIAELSLMANWNFMLELTKMFQLLGRTSILKPLWSMSSFKASYMFTSFICAQIYSPNTSFTLLCNTATWLLEVYCNDIHV